MSHPPAIRRGAALRQMPRRAFLRQTAAGAAVTLFAPAVFAATSKPATAGSEPDSVGSGRLPHGSASMPVPLPHFPDRLHAYVWRNWSLVPVDRLAAVVGAATRDLRRIGVAMGLGPPPRITADQRRRSYLTVIRRNWHLLPYEQLLQLLGWSAEQLAFTLREDDFLFVKLGNLKPRCEPLRYAPPDAGAQGREREIARMVREEMVPVRDTDPLFGFVERLSRKPPPARNSGFGRSSATGLSPRFCYSYFALYGDPLLERGADPYPDGYLARLAADGVDGVWLQAVLYKLAPFPWNPQLSARREERLRNLRELVARARKFGIGVYLYLNEPRAMPLGFFADRPQLKGVIEGDHAALCTSHPEVQNYLVEAVATIGRAVPDLAGFFTITASENLTNCWSHGGGARCPRCGRRSAAEVIAEVNDLFHQGIRRAGTRTRLIVWDWGWPENSVEAILARLSADATLMSVSEWDMPIRRGGVATTVGEYSISAIGPGPRATRHWSWARRRGLKTIAKIQAGNTWELSAVPYIPAIENVAEHAVNLRAAGVDGLMLGWTLGGYPSPNLEVVAEVARDASLTAQGALDRVARRRFGEVLAPAIVRAWRSFSAAFREFPFSGGLVYNAPMQFGPSNLLWAEPTGFHATMIGFPYDDLDGWRGPYPVEVFIAQFEKVADGFAPALADLQHFAAANEGKLRASEQRELSEELSVANAAAIHFRSTANQARFVALRQELAQATTAEAARPLVSSLEKTLRQEIDLARRLHAIQRRDSRIGFEASNQYYYVPEDLVEKILNCRDLLDRWLPSQRQRLGLS